jgi:hypothetical protein
VRHLLFKRAGSKGDSAPASRFQRSKDGVRQIRRSYREHDDDEVIGDDLASVNQRLDELTHQLARMAQANAPRRGERDHAPDRVTDALARLDRRLDQVIQDGRATAGDFDRVRHVMPRQPMRQAAPPAPPAPAANRGPANWQAQISARQRVLDGGPAAATRAAPAAPAAAGSTGCRKRSFGFSESLRCWTCWPAWPDWPAGCCVYG